MSALKTRPWQQENDDWTPFPTEWYDGHDDWIKVSSGASLNQTKVAAGFGLDRNSDPPVLRDEYIAWMKSNNVLEQFKNVPNKDPQLSTWRREWPRLWLSQCSCQRVHNTHIPTGWRSAFGELIHQMAQKHLRYGQVKREPTGSVEPQLNGPSRNLRALSIIGGPSSPFSSIRTGHKDPVVLYRLVKMEAPLQLRSVVFHIHQEDRENVMTRIPTPFILHHQYKTKRLDQSYLAPKMLSFDKLQDIVKNKSKGLFLPDRTQMHNPIRSCDVTDDIDLCSLLTTQVEVNKYNSAVIVLKTSEGSAGRPRRVECYHVLLLLCANARDDSVC